MKVILACGLAIAVASAYYLARSSENTGGNSNLTTYYAAQHLKPAAAQISE